MRPTEQRLDSRELADGCVDDRLVFEVQLAALGRPGQATGHADAVLGEVQLS